MEASYTKSLTREEKRNKASSFKRNRWRIFKRLYITWRGKRCKIDNIILKEKKKVEGLTLPCQDLLWSYNFVFVTHKWNNSTELRVLNRPKYTQPIFEKGARAKWGNKIFSTKWFWKEMDIWHTKKQESGHRPHTPHN